MDIPLSVGPRHCAYLGRFRFWTFLPAFARRLSPPTWQRINSIHVTGSIRSLFGQGDVYGDGGMSVTTGGCL
jgi:hypothetical protein